MSNNLKRKELIPGAITYIFNRSVKVSLRAIIIFNILFYTLVKVYLIVKCFTNVSRLLA